MEFALSEDQKMFQQSVTGYLESASDLDAVRAVADGDAGKQTSISNGLAELGVGQIMVPERFGGLGLGLLDAVLVQEALGAAVSPAAFIGNAMATVGIASAGTEDQQTALLGKLANGEARFGVAVTEAVGAREGAGVTASEGKLSGKSLFALDADQATHIVVADKDSRLHVVDRAASGLTTTPLRTIDRTRTLVELEYKNVEAETLSGENAPGLAVDRMVQCGRMLLAADTLGACQVMIDKAVAYSLERKQFNRAIGSFQAVKHMCAEMAAHLEPARSLVWHAAHARDMDMDEAEIMICLAKSHLSEIGTFIARTSTEVHGGMGMTDLLGLHYWFKRIGVNRQLLGSPERVREDAARLQGWG